MNRSANNLILKFKSFLLKIGFENGNELPGNLFKETLMVFIIRVSAMFLSYIMSFILTHAIGASGFGSYSYAFAWVSVLNCFTVLGFDNVLVREISIYNGQEKWKYMKGLFLWSSIFSTGISILISMLVLIISFSFGFPENSEMRLPMMIAMVSLPFFSFIAILQSTLQGLNKIALGQFFGNILRILLFIALTIIYFFALKYQLSSQKAVWLHVFATIFSCIIFIIIFLKNAPLKIIKTSASFEKKKWTIMAFGFLVLSSVNAINSQTDTILLGAMKSAEEVGIYNIANKLSALIIFSLAIVNLILSPKISNLYSKGEHEKLQELITKGSRISFLLALPVCFLLIFFGKWLLILFGKEFIAGYAALFILCIGQLINLLSGSVGNILIMTHNEKYVIICLAVGALINILLNLALIPEYGIQGAAIASSSGMITWNILMSIFVYKKTGIQTTILGKIIR